MSSSLRLWQTDVVLSWLYYSGMGVSVCEGKARGRYRSYSRASVVSEKGYRFYLPACVAFQLLFCVAL